MREKTGLVLGLSANARQALQQARESGDDDLGRSIAARLQLYEAGKPYHQPRP